jgi:hypothetical protein
MKKTALSLILSIGVLSAMAQNNWQWMMHDQTQNFFAIEADFQLYYNSKVGANGVIPKSTGIKPFKRWEYYWQSRVSPTGEFPVSGSVLEEKKRWLAQHVDSRNYVSGSGTWSLLGPIQTPVNGTGQLNGSLEIDRQWWHVDTVCFGSHTLGSFEHRGASYHD